MREVMHMVRGGRFGKYGELKIKDRIRRNRLQKVDKTLKPAIHLAPGRRGGGSSPGQTDTSK